LGEVQRQRGQTVSEISNMMVAMHREHFGRGPGAARTIVADGLVVCVLSDIYTPAERTLIEAGQADHVRRTRTLHLRALEAEYRGRLGTILERPVEAFLGANHIDPDVCVGTFLLADESSP
jgi:uncharacterized protein YbcI